MKCPKDGSILEEKNLNGTLLDVCSKCDGIWMDWGELKKISRNDVTEYELIYRGESIRKCPRCLKNMRKADLDSVVLEECKCGMFFDSGELEQVLGRKIDLKQTIVKITKDQLKELTEKKEISLNGIKIISE